MPEREYPPDRPQCSLVHEDGRRCERPSTRFKTMCGSCLRNRSPNVKRDQEEQRIENEARALVGEIMTKEKVQIETDKIDLFLNPFDALLQIADEQVQFKEICKAKLEALKADEWRWESDRTGEQLRSEVLLYERAIERCTNTLIKIGRLGIEERLSRIAKRQQAIIEMAIVRTFADMDLTLEQQQRARQRVVEHLMNA